MAVWVLRRAMLHYVDKQLERVEVGRADVCVGNETNWRNGGGGMNEGLFKEIPP